MHILFLKLFKKINNKRIQIIKNYQLKRVSKNRNEQETRNNILEILNN